MEATETRAGVAPPARCACAAGPPRRGGGREMERCPVGEQLWGELIDARDAASADPRRSVSGKKERLDAFATARDLYHAHVRGEAA